MPISVDLIITRHGCSLSIMGPYAEPYAFAGDLTITDTRATYELDTEVGHPAHHSAAVCVDAATGLVTYESHNTVTMPLLDEYVSGTLTQ